MKHVYLHGFNSDGDGWKAAALQRHFPHDTVLAPDLPASPRAVIILLADLIQSHGSDLLLWGTSLGGFYAFYASARYELPAILINPSLQPDQTLAGRGIGHFRTWTKGRPYHFRPEYLPELAELRREAFASHHPGLLRFFLAEDDEVLDLRGIPEQFPTSPVQWVPGAGHGFSKFEKILKQGKMEGWLPA